MKEMRLKTYRRPLATALMTAILASATATAAVAQEIRARQLETKAPADTSHRVLHDFEPYQTPAASDSRQTDFSYAGFDSNGGFGNSRTFPLPGEMQAPAMPPFLKDSLVVPSFYPRYMVAYATDDVLMGLGEKRQAVFGGSYTTGRWTLDTNIGLEKYYMWRNIRNNAFVSGAVTYRLDDHWSMTAFGTYSVNPFYASMGMYPYVTTSRYGGTLNWQSDGAFGFRIGAQREYDPFARRWNTRPIVAPSYKIGKTKIEIDTGPLIQEGLRRLIKGRQNNGPIIMPQLP